VSPHLTQSRLNRGLPLTKWHLNSPSHLATTDMGRKLVTCPFGGGGAGSPFKTIWPGPRPTCVPSFILIHPTVWLNTAASQTGQTDRQTDKADNGPIA